MFLNFQKKVKDVFVFIGHLAMVKINLCARKLPSVQRKADDFQTKAISYT